MFNEMKMWSDFQEILDKDSINAAWTGIFTFSYMTFHLGSPFLGSFSMILIVASFPITALITEGILGVTWYGDLHNAIILIIMGIAADDIFVFYDAWRQSACIEEFKGDKNKRMCYTFRRSSRAMAVTSTTTMAAFCANYFSPIMPIKSFGIFAGIIVPVNYILVVIFYPSFIFIHESAGF
mgnify:CR=1 FL=1